MATPRWDWATVAVGRGQEDPGGSRRIGECGGLPQYFRCSGPTCAVLGSQARCASICLSEQAAVFRIFCDDPCHTLLGLKLQRPRHIRRYSPGRIDGRRIKRFWHDMNMARRILINV